MFVQLSHSWTLPIGSLVVPIRELLSEPELMLDQWFNLDGASPESQILLRAELKVREPQSTSAAVVEGTPQLLFKSQEVFILFFWPKRFISDLLCFPLFVTTKPMNKSHYSSVFPSCRRWFPASVRPLLVRQGLRPCQTPPHLRLNKRKTHL